MTDGVIKTQGTHLFLVDNVTDPENPAILKLACPTGITGMGTGAKSQIPSTCLDATEDEEFVAGLGSPGQVAVPYNFIPTDPSHQAILTTLKESGAVLSWVVGFSDGVALPTLDDDDALMLPNTRTWATFQAYIAENSTDISTNALVTGSMSLQRSGKVNWQFKGATLPAPGGND